MRLAGIDRSYRTPGIAGAKVRMLGALPENLQNSLYAVGTPNSNYNDTPQDRVAAPYPELPYGPAGSQNPWGTVGTAFTIDGRVAGASSAPAIISGGSGGSGDARRRTQLYGLGDDVPLTAPFPYTIKQPYWTGNVYWYTGAGTLNRGAPRFSNDALEYLRSAMVDSDWSAVERWLGWALRNGLTMQQLAAMDFGRYKYVTDANGGNRKQLPFSKADYWSFYENFLKYTSTEAPADAKCIRNQMDKAMRAVNSSPRNQYTLFLGECQLSGSWEKGLLNVVGIIGLVVGGAALTTALTAGTAGAAAGAAGAGAGAGASAGAGAIGAGASAASVASAIIPAGIEVVTVIGATAPVLGAGAGSVAAAIGAGAVVAAAAPPPISPPSIPQAPAPEIPVIETVVTEASALQPVTAGTVEIALTSGVIAATAAAPPIVPAQELPPEVIEEVTTTATRPDPIQIDPIEAAVTGVSVIELTAPTIEVPEPTLPEIQEEPTLVDRITDGLTDAIAGAGSDYVLSELEQYLQDLLGRPPTPSEVDQWQDWINNGANPNAAPGRTPLWVWLALGVAIAVAIYTASKKRRRK